MSKSYGGKCGIAAVAVLSLVWCAPGCGRQTTGPRFQRVEGVVTLGGKPVTSGMIQFLPDSAAGTQGPAASGVIQADGRYELFGPRGLAGAAPGRYRVSISTRTIRSDERRVPTGDIVPHEYSRPETSGLTSEVVVVNGPLRRDFALAPRSSRLSAEVGTPRL